MTTDLIEQYANIGQIASPDMNLKVLLRHQVIPDFLQDCGYVSWRRKTGTVSLVLGDPEYDLAADFMSMQSVVLSGSDKPLQYIGADPEKVIAALSASNAKPYGFYLTRQSGGSFRAIKFSSPSDGSYTGYYVYYMRVPFADDVSPVDLAQYIPEQFHWTLVWGLQKSIYLLRFGVGDNRYLAAEQLYRMGVERASENLELSRHDNPKFVS